MNNVVLFRPRLEAAQMRDIDSLARDIDTAWIAQLFHGLNEVTQRVTCDKERNFLLRGYRFHVWEEPDNFLTTLELWGPDRQGEQEAEEERFLTVERTPAKPGDYGVSATRTKLARDKFNRYIADWLKAQPSDWWAPFHAVAPTYILGHLQQGPVMSYAIPEGVDESKPAIVTVRDLAGLWEYCLTVNIRSLR